MKPVRKILAWQAIHDPPMAEDVRQVLAALLVRPEDAKALPQVIDGLPVEADGCVTPGMVFFVVED